MNNSQKEAITKLVEALENCIPYLYNTVGVENIKLLAEAIQEIKAEMRE